MRNEEQRAAWREESAQRDPQQLVFVDESGTHTSLTRLYGWAPHDQRATGTVPRNHGKNTTLVAALTPDGVQAPWTIEGAMDTSACERYVTEMLGPTLRPGQVVVLDNLSVHKSASIREAIVARGCELLFLPPYSPDLTPIEQAFSKVKALVRGLGPARATPSSRPCAQQWPRSPPKMQLVGSPTRAIHCPLNVLETVLSL